MCRPAVAVDDDADVAKGCDGDVVAKGGGDGGEGKAQEGEAPERKLLSPWAVIKFLLRLCTVTGGWMFIVIGVCDVILYAVGSTRGPRVEPFYVGNPDYWYPFTKTDEVPIWQLAVVYFGCYFPVMILLEVFLLRERRQPWSSCAVDVLRTLLGFCGAVLACDAFNNLLKWNTGVLRPDFYERCFGQGSSPPPSSDYRRVITSNADCVQQGYVLDFGRSSFPSGHAATGFAGGIYMMLFLNLCAWRLQRSALSQLMFALSLLPFGYGMWESTSRITDYEHTATDVLGSAAFCVVIAPAYFAWVMCVRVLDRGREAMSPQGSGALAPAEEAAKRAKQHEEGDSACGHRDDAAAGGGAAWLA